MCYTDKDVTEIWGMEGTMTSATGIQGERENPLMDAVLASISEPFFIYDRKGTYIDIIGGSDRKHYHDANTMIGKTLYDVFPTKTARKFHDRIKETLKLGETLIFEYSINPEDISDYRGKPGPVGLRWFEAHISPVLTSDGSADEMVVWVAFDITDHKKAIEIQEMQKKQLKELSMTDSLTGFLNRRSFYESSQLVIHSIREGKIEGACLLMMDLDHFKRINDTYGHQTGDKVLMHISNIIESQIRSEDLIGRIGGEEFALILTGCTIAGAAETAGRIRQKIESTPFEHENISLIITISIGISLYHQGENDIQSALTRADEAMYLAKRLGRNRVERVS